MKSGGGVAFALVVGLSFGAAARSNAGELLTAEWVAQHPVELKTLPPEVEEAWRWARMEGRPPAQVVQSWITELNRDYAALSKTEVPSIAARRDLLERFRILAAQFRMWVAVFGASYLAQAQALFATVSSGVIEFVAAAAPAGPALVAAIPVSILAYYLHRDQLTSHGTAVGIGPWPGTFTPKEFEWLRRGGKLEALALATVRASGREDEETSASGDDEKKKDGDDDAKEEEDADDDDYEPTREEIEAISKEAAEYPDGVMALVVEIDGKAGIVSVESWEVKGDRRTYPIEIFNEEKVEIGQTWVIPQEEETELGRYLPESTKGAWHFPWDVDPDEFKEPFGDWANLFVRIKAIDKVRGKVLVVNVFRKGDTRWLPIESFATDLRVVGQRLRLLICTAPVRKKVEESVPREWIKVEKVGDEVVYREITGVEVAPDFVDIFRRAKEDPRLLTDHERWIIKSLPAPARRCYEKRVSDPSSPKEFMFGTDYTKPNSPTLERPWPTDVDNIPPEDR